MTKQQRMEQIAREHLGIETLEPRRRDSLDFHEVPVWQVAKGRDAAYRAGLEELLGAPAALIEAKDNQMETNVEWRHLRRAVARAQKAN